MYPFFQIYVYAIVTNSIKGIVNLSFNDMKCRSNLVKNKVYAGAKQG